MYDKTGMPQYVVSFYLATYGQNGNNLGSDEKEIILLVYVIINTHNGDIVASKQIIVRPEGNWNNQNNMNNSGDSVTTVPLYSEQKNFENLSASTSNAVKPIVMQNNSVTLPLVNGASDILCISTNFGNILSKDIDENGKHLSEALEEFNIYLQSHSINYSDVVLVTDGQLPLRQCLHPEACAKGIILPDIYNKFCDLRKEFQNFKSGDLSKALVPMKDLKKILQLPIKPLPDSISEMLAELDLTNSSENDFYVKESFDMATIIQKMIKSGHKFTLKEDINLVLEPGICSIDDKIDGNCVVRARGLPWQSSDQDIAKFFRGLNVAKGGVALCLSPLGRRNGEALIRFVSQEHRDMALKRHKHHIGQRYIEVYRASGEDFLSVAGGASNEAQAFLSKGAQVIIRMRGLPYDCTAKQVLEFFNTGENPCDVLDGTDGVLFVKKPDGRATGDAFVLFATEIDAPKALARHRESIGQRYIELFRSTTAEVQQVLNRCMDPKNYESNHVQTPLISQLPPVPMSLLPQHLITSGTIKNCIRLRGLPYEALVEHILHFLDDFAKHIIYQGVHMVINAQGQPSGEAFIQMDSEDAAMRCAQRKHNQFMVFGKKYRYIEVFQCSGDDMNLVLNGGLQTPQLSSGHIAAATSGKPTSIITSGMLVQPQHTNPQTLSPHNHSHISLTSHTLQSQPNMSSAIALAQPSHMPLSSICSASGMSLGTNPPVVNSLQSFSQQPNIASPSSVQHSGPLITPQHTIALNSASGHLTLPQISIGNSSIPGLPFNISVPQTQINSTNNSALIAQQAQAQFIAQQTLIARQQSAAAVEQQNIYTNLMNPLFLPQTSPSLPPSVFSPTSGQPHLMIMPRPYFHPMPIGYSMPTQNIAYGTVPSVNLHSTSNSVSNIQQTMKRSYENAFQQDSGTSASVPKRTFTRTPSNSYFQFYNP